MAASGSGEVDESYNPFAIDYEADVGLYSFAYNNSSSINVRSETPIEFFPDGDNYIYAQFDLDKLYKITSQHTGSEKFVVHSSDKTGAEGNSLFDTTNGSGPIQQAFVNPSATKAYLVKTQGNYSFYSSTWGIWQYDLSSSGQLDSHGSGTNTLSSFSQHNTGDPKDISFSDNGTTVIVLRAGNNIAQYTLSTAYDLTSTVTYTNKSLSTSSSDTPYDLFTARYANSGNLLIVGDNQNLYTYDLSTAYDISTASYNASKSKTGNFFPYGISSFTFNSNGTRVYINQYSFSPKVYHYPLSTAYDLSTVGSATTISGSPYSMRSHYSENGNYFFWYSSANQVFGQALSSSFADPTWEYQYGLSITGTGHIMDFKTLNTGSANKLYVSRTDGYIYQYTASTSNFANSSTYDNKSLNAGSYMYVGYVNGWSIDPGARFSIASNGTKLITMQNNTVNQWGLSTAYDISTATLDGSYSLPSLPTIPQASFQRGVLSYSPDGSELYVMFAPYSYSASMYIYSLSTDWDVSTASLSSATNPPFGYQFQNTRVYDLDTSRALLFGIGPSGNTTSSFVVPQKNTMSSSGWYGKVHTYLSDPYKSGMRAQLAPNNDEDKMYYIEHGDKLRSVSLSTPGDYATASLDSNIKSISSSYIAPQISCYDDENLFIGYASGSKCYTGTMSTPGDVSTLSLDTTNFVTLTSPRAVVMARDGLKIWATHSLSYLYYFTLSTAYDLSTASAKSTDTSVSLNTFIHRLYIDGPSSSKDDYMYACAYDNNLRVREKDSSATGYGAYTATGTKCPILGESEAYSTNAPVQTINQLLSLDGGSKFIISVGVSLGNGDGQLLFQLPVPVPEE